MKGKLSKTKTKKGLHKESKEKNQRIMALEAAEKERRKAEEARHELEELVRTTLRSIGDAVISTDGNGIVKSMNHTAEELTGWSQEKAVGKPLEKVFIIRNEDTGNKVENPVKRVLREGVAVGLANHTMLIRKDGTRIPIADSGAPIRNDAGEIIGTVLVFQDITERRKAERAIQEAREYAENIVETVREHLVVLDSDLRVVTANHSFYRAFKVAPKETEGQLLYDLGNKQWEIPKLRELLEKILPKNTKFDNFEVEHDFKTIGQRTMLLNARRLEQEGKTKLILLAIEDITERRKAEKELKKHREHLEELVEERTAEVEAGKERIEHLNSVLLAVRNINQLITKEKDGNKLIGGACKNLIETSGYSYVWIALFDKSGIFLTSSDEGLGKKFSPIAKLFEKGILNYCYKKAIEGSEVVVIEDTKSTCKNCSLAKIHGENKRMSVRLEYGQNIYGVLTVSISPTIRIDEEEKTLFKEIAGDIAFALHNLEVEEERKQAEEKTAKQQKIMNAINAVFKKALVCEREEDLAKTCLEVAQELVGAKFGFFGEVNPEGKFDTLAISNPGWDACKMPESEATKIINGMEIHGMQFLPLKDGKSRIFNDPSNHPDSVGTPEGHPEITCLLAVPLRYGGKVIGEIGLGNKEGGYDLNDQQAIEALSVAMVEALMRKRAEEALRQSEHELAIRNNIANIFLTTPDEEMYDEVLQVVLEAMESKYGTFGYIDEEGALVVPTMTRETWDNYQAADKKIIFLPETWGDSTWANAIREKKTIYSNEPSTNVPIGDIPIQRHISMPIIHSGKVIGLIQVADKKTDYTDKDIQLLENTCNAIAPVLKARIERDMQESARREAEIETLEAKERYDELITGIPDAVYSALPDETGTTVFMSERWKDWTGYSPEDFYEDPETWTKSIHPEDRDMAINGYIEACKNKTEYISEYRVVHKDTQNVRFLRNHGVPILNEQGDLVRIDGIVSDITERKRAEEEQERLNTELATKNKELEQLLYVTSHDLRSPLVNVQGFSKELDYSLNKIKSVLASEDVPTMIKEQLAPILERDIPDSLNYIQTSISKMDSLLSGLLRLSRLGRETLNIKPLDMNNVISNVIDAFEYQIKEKGVKLEIGDLPPCRGDKMKINQMFSNLLDNSLKYLDPSRSGIIRITGRRQKGQSVYCLEDNGIGVPPEYQGKIFQIFHRLNQDENVKGEGLGLTIVKRTLDRHGGKIWMESELGNGSKFFTSLPTQ